MQGPCRNLVVILGDQLDRGAAAWDGFDARHDVAWMAEVAAESTHVWSSQPRIAIFLAAMRHFAAALRDEGIRLAYRALDDEANRGRLDAELSEALTRLKPQRVVVTQPGEWRVQDLLQTACASAGVPLDIREDRHFFCTLAQFRAHAAGKRQLRMEAFYREQRRRHRVLMDGEQPCGGSWNFDADNRGSFGRAGPGLLLPPLRFEPDAMTRDVIALVRQRFGEHPGSLDSFGWAVTREQARAALDDFIGNRLASFGPWQDAMWSGEPFLHHSLLSAALNLKLLEPQEVVAAAERAYRDGSVPLASAEGFIRQVLGWREYVRGVYWTRMPQYLELNALDAREPLPAFYWTGETSMRCLREAITQTLAHGYAHHIQRLMVTGLYAMLLGVEPKQVHAWYLAVYVDAVEWVELPNTLGMSQHGDGGFMASKPYAATGRYIERMSDYCRGCRFDPGKRTGDDACPFTTLYWDFLARQEQRLQANVRIGPQLRNMRAITPGEMQAIRARAADIRSGKAR